MDEQAIKQIEAALPRMRDRWLGGGDAAPVAPAEWSGSPLKMLALAGHALEVLRTPRLPAGVVVRPPLPQLGLPLLMDGRRTLIRRALAAAKTDQEGQSAVIRLLAARGYVVHPEDWHASVTQLQDIEIYAPWAAWREGAVSRATDETPTAATWQDWSWIERRNALARLRALNPTAGRTLLQAIFPSEPADRRLVLLSALAKGLSADDMPFLEGLAADRSDKVKQLARRMLTRLGQFNTPGESEIELADFFEIGKKGLLRRTAVASLKPIKTPAQRQRLMDLFELATLPALATQLGLSEADLVQALETSQHTPDAAFVTLTLLTGSPAANAALLARIEDDFPLMWPTVAALNELAPDAWRERLMAAGVRREGDPGFTTSLALSARHPGMLSRQALEQSPAWKVLIAIATATSEDSERLRNHQLARGLSALGILCSAGAARFVIEAFTGLGLSPADPVLTNLTLNAALNAAPDERPSA